MRLRDLYRGGVVPPAIPSRTKQTDTVPLTDSLARQDGKEDRVQRQSNVEMMCMTPEPIEIRGCAA